MRALIPKLRQRKLVEWTLAYLAGAWLVLQIVDVLGERWGLTPALGRGIDVALVVGLLIAGVFAWYHGERGRQRVSGPELIIIAGLLGIGGVAVRLVVPGLEEDIGVVAPLALQRGIAVLPFESLSTRVEDGHFADGLHASLIAGLERTTSGVLRVIARQAVLPYRDSPTSPIEIGQALGVGFLLTGSVQRSGDQVRLAVALVDAETGVQLWDDAQNRVLTPDALFEVQQEAVTGILGQLQINLRREELRQSVVGTDSVRAAELVIRAVGMPCGMALPLLEEAAAVDPAYVTSHALLGECHSLAWTQGDRSAERLRLARYHAERAIELAPDDPDARLAMVWFLYYTKQWQDALALLDRAPNSWRSEFKYLEVRSYAARRLGRLDESLTLGLRLLDLAPGLRYGGQVGLTLILLGRYSEAIDVLEADTLSQGAGRPEYLALARWFETEDVGALQVGGSIEADFLKWDALMLRGDWSGALEMLPDTARVNRGTVWYPNSLMRAWNLELGGRESEAAAAFQEAYAEAQARSEQNREDAQALSTQALALSGLGRAEEAVALGTRAVDLAPPASDALEAPAHLLHLVSILARAGNHEGALSRLREFVVIPSLYPPIRLRGDHLLRPLHGLSEFEEVLAAGPQGAG